MSNAALSVLRNSTFTVGAQVLVRVVNVVVMALLTRYLGDSLFGRYTYAVYLGSLFSLLADFRLNIPLVRELAREHQDAEGYLHQLLSLRLVLSLLCILVLAASLPLVALTPVEKGLLVLAGLGSIAGAFSTTFAGLFQALERLQFVALQTVIQAGLGAAVTLLTIWLRGPVWWVVCGLLLANVVSTGVLAFFTRRELGCRPWRWAMDVTFWKRMLVVAAPLAAVALLDALHFRNDLVLLRHFHGERWVGIYGVPFRLVDALIMMELAFLSAVFPVVSRIYARSQATFERAWEKLLKLVLALGLPLGLSVTALAPHLLPLFGPRFVEGAPAFQWIIWVAVLAFIAQLTHFFLITANLQNWIVMTFGAALATNLGLNLWLIPRHALVGAGIAKVISEAVAVLLAGAVLLRRLPPVAWGQVLRPLPAAAAMGVTLWAGRALGAWSLALAVPVYLLTLWLTGAVTPDEAALLRAWLKGARARGQNEAGEPMGTEPPP